VDWIYGAMLSSLKH